jgi:hypothetical protein
MRLTRVGFVAIGMLAACGGAKPAETKPEPEPAAETVTPEAAHAGCMEMFTRQRECTDTFIPALVGWRVELDVPAGVAEQDRTLGREALVAKAKEEWAASNSDEQLASLCIDVIAGIPADQLGPMIAVGRACNASETCEAFTACLEPAQRQRLAAQKQAEAGAEP